LSQDARYPSTITCCRSSTTDCQRFPTTGKLSQMMNWSLDNLQASLKDREGTVYSYVVRTVGEDGGRLFQRGSGPNVEGGYITLCTCKHGMRTYMDARSWKGIWVAGFTGVTSGQHQNDLFYLMKVGWAFASHRDLWYSNHIPVATKRAKAAHRNRYGDLFRPKRRGIDPYNPACYRSPTETHSHNWQQEWHDDIRHFSSNGKPAVLLVGDPAWTFLWDRPMVSFRQACMNRREGFGMVGCHREMVRRTADENPNNT